MRALGWATIAGLEMGLIGPFGSYAANPFTRIAYWIGLCWLGFLILRPGIEAAVARGGARGLPPFFSASLALLIGCVPLAACAAAGCILFWPVHATGIRTLEWYGSTLLTAGPLAAALLLLERYGVDAPEMQHLAAPPAGNAGQPPPVPPHQLALALCLQMEDHHVRLHLPGGSILHLASLRDTIAQAGETRGLQAHRSWWVARDAVRGWATEGRTTLLLLANGLEVPVARNRVAQLRAEGWLGG